MWGAHSSVAEYQRLLGYGTVLSGEWLPAFQKDRKGLVFMVKQSKKRPLLDYLTVKKKCQELLTRRHSVKSQKTLIYYERTLHKAL
jgi:hypothetical protein